jgi:hypothetical protein
MWRPKYSLFIVDGDTKSPLKRCVRVKFYQTVRIAEEVQTFRERATMLHSTYIACLVLACKW